AYTRVITLDPLNAHAYGRLGWSLNQLARFEDAIAPLKMALQLGGDDTDAYRELGYAWRKLGQSDLAIAAYTELRRLDAHSEVPHFVSRMSIFTISRSFRRQSMSTGLVYNWAAVT